MVFNSKKAAAVEIDVVKVVELEKWGSEKLTERLGEIIST